MAKKISLWISALFHPVSQSPLSRSPSDEKTLVEEFGFDEFSASSIPWTIGNQQTETLVQASPDIRPRLPRKESIGDGVIVREQLIRDLE